MVALKSNTSIFEAARAIENNNIGAVVVQDQGSVVGIVTDRDIAIRVVGQGRDPRTTTLSEVMTTPVMTLASTDSQSEALQIMRQRNIRRIPLVDAGRLVGIATLDDMLLDEIAPLDQVAAVVQTQIGEGGPAGPVSSRAATRWPDPGDLRSSAQPLADGLPQPLDSFSYALAVDSKFLFAGLGDGRIYRSEDGGNRWELLNLSGAPPTCVLALIPIPITF